MLKSIKISPECIFLEYSLSSSNQQSLLDLVYQLLMAILFIYNSSATIYSVFGECGEILFLNYHVHMM